MRLPGGLAREREREKERKGDKKRSEGEGVCSALMRDHYVANLERAPLHREVRDQLRTRDEQI